MVFYVRLSNTLNIVVKIYIYKYFLGDVPWHPTSHGRQTPDPLVSSPEIRVPAPLILQIKLCYNAAMV